MNLPEDELSKIALLLDGVLIDFRTLSDIDLSKLEPAFTLETEVE